MAEHSQTTELERREFFSRHDIEDLIRREMHVYMPTAKVEWQSDGSAVVVWSEKQEQPANAE